MSSSPSSSSPISSTSRSLQRLTTFKTSPTVSSPSSSNPLDSFSSDPILSTFLSPSFSPTQFSSTALSSGSAASRIELLQSSLRLLDTQLRSEVLSKHPHLLHQLSSLNTAESNLSSLRSSISSLQSSLKRARSELSDPHCIISLQTKQLNNLHTASTLLHHTLRCLRMVYKLKGLISSSKWDLTKAGQLHCEILGVYNDSECSLIGIDVVDVEIKWVLEIGTRIRSEGMSVLEKGLEGLNQPEVGLGLQVFYNLGELKTTVDGLVGKYKMMGVRSLGIALDMKAVSSGGSSGGGMGGVRRDGTPQLGSGGKAKEALWGRMSVCMDQLHGILIAVWHLQRVLAKKRDPFTLVVLLDEVIQEGDPTLTERVWDALVKSFASQMKSVFTASSFVKEIFTLGYPKLLTMIDDLLERILRDTDVKGVPPAISSEGKGQMIAAIEMFQTAFLTLCLSRLTDLVNSVFPMSNRGNVLSKEHMLRVASRIKEEIEAVHLDARLTLLVLREISKVLLLLAERAEYQISTGPEARQITEPATPAQLKNFTLCQNLQEVHTRITSIVSPLPTVASDVLSAALGTIYGVAGDSVTSLFQSMLDHLESCILQIHDQNFSTLGMDAATDDNSSPYMEELQKSILHFRAEFLSRLLPSSGTFSSTETICTRLVQSMASRVLTFFIRHASLVRPLSESGKLRMARDMAELELAVGQNLFPVEQLGAPYRALRAFRPVIFLETPQLGSSPLLQDLPASVILHHLYSRGPDDLLSPLQRNKLTPIQYSLWMDSQGEDQIWKGIKATLDDYAAKVRGRGDKEFDPVYPLMLKIGSSLSENQS